MSELKIGYCGLCNTNIWDDVLDKNGRVVGRKPNSEYAEVATMLSNGTMAKLAVCSKCASGITDADINTLFAQVQGYWRSEMVGWATDRQFAKMDKLTIKAWDRDEKKSINKYNTIREKEHREKVEKRSIKK